MNSKKTVENSDETSKASVTFGLSLIMKNQIASFHEFLIFNIFSDVIFLKKTNMSKYSVSFLTNFIMKEVLALIEEKKHEFAQLPLFKFMQDKTIDPMQRLAFAPCLAPFAMGFADLNKYALRKEPATNKIEEIINLHTYEDDNHWEWFLEDLKTLGIDREMPFSDALRFMWSDETAKTRHICTRLAALCIAHADPVLKLVVIEAIEATGNVALFWTSEVAKEIGKTSKKRYRYFGISHYMVETGHATGTDEIEAFIESIELTQEEREKAFYLVKEVFDAFTHSMQEMMFFLEKNNFSPSVAIS